MPAAVNRALPVVVADESSPFSRAIAELLPSVFPAPDVNEQAPRDRLEPPLPPAGPAMSRPERNGFSRTAESSLLAERLQVDRGSVPRRARDPHAELKTKIHRTCIARLGSAFLNLEGSDELASRVRMIVNEELTAEEAPLSPADRADLERQIADDILGYGPLSPTSRTRASPK